MLESTPFRRALVGLAVTAVTASTLLVSAPAFGASATVATSSQLATALAAAKPGDTITLASGTYSGTFVAAVAGTSSAPITLSGPRSAVLTTGSTGSGYGLHVKASNWRLSGFTIATAAKGLVLDNADGTVIDGLDIGSIGQEALHVRTGSSAVTIRNSVIHDTGLTSAAYGEGIYVGSANSNWSTIMGSSSTPDRSDGVLIEGNTISNTTAEGIDIKEGTTGGRVIGNTFDRAGFSGANYADSWIDVKGNGYVVSGNTGRTALLDAFQVHTAMTGWGNDNSFTSNTIESDVPGLEVSVQKGATGTVVACDSSEAASGLTNITCTPATAPSPPPTAIAAPVSSISVSGAALAGSTQPLVFTVVANAPAGSTVKFKLDGVYLGQDSTAPYSWPVTTTAGSHKLNARWDANGTTASFDAVFTAR